MMLVGRLPLLLYDNDASYDEETKEQRLQYKFAVEHEAFF